MGRVPLPIIYINPEVDMIYCQSLNSSLLPDVDDDYFDVLTVHKSHFSVKVERLLLDADAVEAIGRGDPGPVEVLLEEFPDLEVIQLFSRLSFHNSYNKYLEIRHDGLLTVTENDVSAKSHDMIMGVCGLLEETHEIRMTRMDDITDFVAMIVDERRVQLAASRHRTSSSGRNKRRTTRSPEQRGKTAFGRS